MLLAIHGRIYGLEGWIIDNPLVRDSRVLKESARMERHPRILETNQNFMYSAVERTIRLIALTEYN